MSFKTLYILILSAGCLLGQSTPATNTAPVTVTAAAPVINFKPELEAQAKDLAEVKAGQEKLENNYQELKAKYGLLSKADAEVQAALKVLEDGLKLYEGKLAVADKNLEELKLKLGVFKEEVAGINKRAEEESMQTNSLKTGVEAFKVKLQIAEDDIKVRSDEIKALKDTLLIMRGNLNSNITDTIEIKQALSELKEKERGKKGESILDWEYLGVVTSGVAVLALILAIAK